VSFDGVTAEVRVARAREMEAVVKRILLLLLKWNAEWIRLNGVRSGWTLARQECLFGGVVVQVGDVCLG
jgi:hypothetical protein